MKLKYLILTIFICFPAGTINSQLLDFSGLTVVVNPGHGGHDSDDRGMPNGFWESESNLTKGLWLRDLLEARGCNVIMSRVLNRTEDDLPLSHIAALANDNEADLFISIHSNAGNQVSNYPLTIFNGKSETPAIPESKVWAQILWEQLITNEATFWTHTDPHYIGDLTLNPSWTYGYGVLYPLQVPGIISEGSFHDYQPEVDRLLNLEYRKQEAWNMLYAMVSYFNLPGTDETGNITGIIRDSFLINESYNTMDAPDRYLPVNGAKVEIMETGESYLTDQFNTGFYYFDSIASGNYHLIFSANDYFIDTVEVTVNPHQHNHTNYWLRADKTMPAKIISNSPLQGELSKCFDPVVISFNMNMDSTTTVNAFSISPEINGTFTWDKYYVKLNFQPDIPYETNTEYTVTLDSTAEHQWGVRIDTTLVFSFITDDRNRFHLESSFPVNEQLNISPFLQFRLIFDAPLNNTSLIGSVSIESAGNDPVSTRGASISTIDNKGHYYFSPAEDLEYATTYILKLQGSIKDENGIPMVDTTRIEFTTMDEPGPQEILDELEDTKTWSLNHAESSGLDPESFIYKWSKIERSGLASMLLRYDFSNESAFAIVSPSAPINLKNARKLSIWLWGDMSMNSVFALFDNETEEEFGQLDFAGWKLLSIDLSEEQTELTHLKFNANPGSVLNGDIYLDALSIPNTTSYASLNPHPDIDIYPNPLNTNKLYFKGLQEINTKYKIYNLQGRVLQQGYIEKTEIELVLNKVVLQEAMFIIRLQNDKINFSKKIINLNP